jgi:hypothetical protein
LATWTGYADALKTELVAVNDATLIAARPAKLEFVTITVVAAVTVTEVGTEQLLIVTALAFAMSSAEAMCPRQSSCTADTFEIRTHAPPAGGRSAPSVYDPGESELQVVSTVVPIPGASTLMVTLPLEPAADAVTVAVPTAVAVTSPPAVTVATLGVADCQLTGAVTGAGRSPP